MIRSAHTSRTLLSVAIAALVAGMDVAGAEPITIHQAIPTTTGLHTRSRVTVSLFDAQAAVVPVATERYLPGEWEWVGENRSAITMAFELPPAVAELPEVWVETAVDGVPVGDRELLALDGLGVTFALGNTLNMDGNRITNLGTPSVGTDAATRQFVLDELPVNLSKSNSGKKSANESKVRC